jgi:hypothetical protein
MHLPRSLLALCALIAPIAGLRGDLLQFYAYPPTADYPDTEGKTFFSWLNSDTDPYTAVDPVGLRSLNETVAGESGWVTQAGGRFLSGDGTPLRFWAVNVTGQGGYNVARGQSRFLAKRGVNMVRVHGPRKSLFANTSIHSVNNAVVDQLQAVVAAMKNEGIYTFISNTYFVIELQVQAGDGMPGYTATWLENNPNFRVPYGLIFLDDTLRNAYKGWLTELMTRPNPYDPQGLPLAGDTAVAIVELLNEDSVFFNTFNPEQWPPEMQAIQESRFFEWVGHKYLNPNDPDDTVAKAAARVRSTIWFRNLVRDNVETGRFQLVPAVTMSQNARALLPRNRDQVAFLAEMQEGFYAEMTAHLRSLGYGGTVVASNWKTINDERLLDLELATYTAAGVIDRHRYYSPAFSQTSIFFRISPGDRFLPISALLNPRQSPLVSKRVEGYPLTMSEQIWSQYTPTSGEAPVAVASYMSLSDMNAWVWFALDGRTWRTGEFTPWPTENPAILAQFPAAALLYRRGYLAEAGTVLREARSRESLTSLDRALLTPDGGYDYFRDNPANFPTTPVPGTSIVDPAIALVGKAVLDLEDVDSLLLPEVFDSIDYEADVIHSMTRQLTLDASNGLLLIDAPQTQGVNGFLGRVGPIDTSDLRFELRNAFGAIVAVSLDQAPLAASARILVQAFTSDRRTGFAAERVPIDYKGQTLTGVRIINSGVSPYQVEHVDASVTLKGVAARFSRAVALDANLYERAGGGLAATVVGDDVVLTLPNDGLYTLIELQAPPTPSARIHDRVLPNARVGVPYQHALRVAGSAAGTWQVRAAGAESIPGLTLAPDGTVSGVPQRGGYHRLQLDYLLDGVVVDQQDLPLVVEPVQSPGPWGTPSNQLKFTSIGPLLDLAYPYVYHVGALGWFSVERHSTAGGTYLYAYDGELQGWLWANPASARWVYAFALNRWVPL